MNNFKDFDIKPKSIHLLAIRYRYKSCLTLHHRAAVQSRTIQTKGGTELLTLQIEKSGRNEWYLPAQQCLSIRSIVCLRELSIRNYIKGDNDYYEFT
jgi:hypothetical protein